MKLLLTLLLAVLGTEAALAQSPELLAAYPAGGQRGTTATLTLRGHNLQAASVVLVSGKGVRAEIAPGNKDGDNLPLRLTIAPDAPLGPREIRVATPKGGSNPAWVWIDLRPETNEAEPNDEPSHAQTLKTLPVLVNGTMDAPGDRDSFAFRADAGETFVFDLNCWRHRSAMDGVLELRDERGNLLRLATAPWEADPRLTHTFARAGRYTLTVHDTQFLGGPQYTYRLTLGPIPIPVENYSHVVRPVEAVSGQIVWLAAETPSGPTLPAPFWVESVPVSEMANGSQLPAPPIAVNSRIAKLGEAVTFPFAAKAGQTLRFDVLAQRIGAAMDSNLRILDRNGKELAANDDGGTLLAGTAAGIGKDSRLDWKAPADGDYRVEITDLAGSPPAQAYFCLKVTLVVPEFRLRVNETKAEVAQGGASLLTVTAERQNGFTGDIALHAENLPVGVACSGGILAAGQESAEITLAAEAGAKLDLRSIRVLGTATIGGKTTEREAVFREQYLPRAIDPGMFTDDSYRRPYRDCLLSPLTVTELAESFTLRAETPTVNAAPGQTLTLRLRAARKPGTDGEIKFAVHGLPQEIKADLKPIAAKTSETTVTLTIPPTYAAPSTLRLIFIGTLDKQTQVCPMVIVNIVRK